MLRVLLPNYIIIWRFAMKRRSSDSGSFRNILMGGLIGAAVALILAPQKGTATRRQLMKYGKRAGNTTQRFLSGIAESLDDTLQDLLVAGGEGVVKGRKLTSRARSEILEMLDAGKVYIEEERKKLEKIFR
jgi:gas vesicle protein